MSNVVFYFQLHQPYRIDDFSTTSIGTNTSYFKSTENINHNIFNKVAANSYYPMLNLLNILVNKHKDFKFALSFSGLFLEQAIAYQPDLINIIRALIKSSNVEILSETYYHSLASVYSKKELNSQVLSHTKLINKLFNYSPKVFRNTELVYSNDIAKWAEKKGYIGILAEGWDKYMTNGPGILYRPIGTDKICVLTKNYSLSDDIAFRFSDKSWESYPLTTDKYMTYLRMQSLNNVSNINIFMDFETFGEQHHKDTMIFDFFNKLVNEISKDEYLSFSTPSEVINKHNSSHKNNHSLDIMNVEGYLTWADSNRDLSAWTGNILQQSVAKKIYTAFSKISSYPATLIDDWRKLQTSDHLYYLSDASGQDGDVHAYFSPYDSPFQAYVNVNNAIEDIILRKNTIDKLRGVKNA